MKIERNIPLNWDMVHSFLGIYCKENNMILNFKVDANKISVKILKEGFPIILDLYETKSGMTINPDLGKDREANQNVVDYILNHVNFDKLSEKRASFRNVSSTTVTSILDTIKSYCAGNGLSFQKNNRLDSRYEVLEELIDNSVKIDVFSSGTIFLHGYSTEVFNEIYNIVLVSTKQLPTELFNPIIGIADYARPFATMIQNECNSCRYISKCNSSGSKMLNFIHFERNTSKYPCNKVLSTYICRYIFRYSSELTNILNIYKEEVIDKQQINVLSLGCGVCPDLFALRYLFQKKPLKFMGIDYNRGWSRYHEYISSICLTNSQNSFFYNDIFEIIEKLNRTEKKLDFNLVFLNYFVSTLTIDHDLNKVAELFKGINEHILQYLLPGSMMIVNDINNKEYFVDVMEYIIANIQINNFVIERFYHMSDHRRYLECGTPIESPNIHFYVSKKLINEFNTQIECNSAAFVFRRIE